MAAESKLTDRRLRGLKPGTSEQLVGDGGGLWVRVLPAEKGGAINFYYRYQLEGKERRFNCGSYPETPLSQARARRDGARKLVREGRDPVEQAAAARSESMAAQALDRLEKSVDDLFADWKRVYLDSHHADKGAFAEAVYNFDVRDQIGKMKAKAVRLPHIVQVIDKVLDRGAKRKANVVLANLRQMFRHGLGRGIVETDPTLGLNRRHAGGKEQPVTRNLSLEEIQELHAKLPDAGLHSRMVAGIWLILATGARVGELLKSRWADFDLKANTWTVPAENAKNSREHLIHLSTFARRQVDELATVRAGEYLFHGQKPDTHISEKSLSKAIRDRIRPVALKRRTPRTGTLLLAGGEWTPHDLRRTMASRMGDLAVAPHVIERCLNHIQPGLVGVYQRQEYIDDRRAAFESWGARLIELTSPTT